MRVADRVRAGMVWINTYRVVSYMSPFGGVKRSGVGRESGIDAIEQFLETKAIWMNLAEEFSNPFVQG